MENNNNQKYGKRRKWFFTLWNTEFDFEELWNDYNDIIRYVAGQLEEGEKSKRLHFQGCIHLKDPCRLSYVRFLLRMGKKEKSGKLVPQKGTNKQVLDYVHKIRTSKGKKFEFGEPSRQGIRTDLRQIMKRIREGATELDIFDEFPTQSFRYQRAITKYRELIYQEKFSKFRKLNVHFISGPTDFGKTRRAYDLHGYNSYKVFKINCNDLEGFWNGYNGQDVVIFDEFANQVKITKLLELLDGYPFMVNTKGSFVPAQFTKVFITSNLKKDRIYPNAYEEHKKALFRRINSFIDLYPKILTKIDICPRGVSLGNIGINETATESPRSLDIFEQDLHVESDIEDYSNTDEDLRLIDVIK